MALLLGIYLFDYSMSFKTWVNGMIILTIELVSKIIWINEFYNLYYALSLKGLPGTSSNRIVPLSVIPSRLHTKCNI